MRSQFLEAVVGRDEDEAGNGSQAGQVNRDAAAQAAAHDDDIGVLDANLVEESEGVSEKRGFGRLARTSSVTPVMQQVDGVVGERSRKSGQIVGDIFRIT